MKFFKLFNETTDKTENEVQSSNVITIEKLLTQISEKFGRDFTENLYHGKKKADKYVQIFINDEEIKVLQG